MVAIPQITSVPQQPPELQAADALVSAGFMLKGPIVPGEWQNLPSPGKRSHDRSGYYKYDDLGSFQIMTYGSFSGDYHAVWSSVASKNMSAADIETARKKLEEYRSEQNELKKQRQNATASVVLEKIESLPVCVSHEYLDQKKALPHDCYLDGESLIIPAYDIAGNVRSMQRIYWDSKEEIWQKKFTKYGQIEGTMCFVGEFRAPEKIFVTEGFSTASSVHQASRKPTVCAWNARNIPKAVSYTHLTLPTNREV